MPSLIQVLNKIKHTIMSYKVQTSIVAVFVALWFTFYALNPMGFSNLATYTAIASITPFTIIPALSLTFIIIMGEIDLSFSSVMALGALVLALTWKSIGPSPLGVLGALMAGSLAGFLNGVLVAKLKLPSLIVTIGTMYLWRGIILVISQGFGIPLGEFRGLIVWRILNGRLIYDIPIQFIWAAVFAMLFWYILNRHKFGAYIYYIGDNRIAARYLGISVEKIMMLMYTIHGVMAAFAGVLCALEMASFWPALGDVYMLKCIAAIIIGGTPITGGTGTILGTFIGALILDFISTGILAAKVTGFWIQVTYGLIIVIALTIQALLRGKIIKS